MCVWVGRACSTWSVRRQEPPAVGAHGAPAVGSFKKSLYVALVRGRRTREELLARRDRCVYSGSSADPNAGFSYDVASCVAVGRFISGRRDARESFGGRRRGRTARALF